MLVRRQPQSLQNCALQRLIKFIASYEHPYEDDLLLFALRNYLTIPPILFDRLADDLLSAINRSDSKSHCAQYLVFGSALSRLNLDDFPSLQGNITAFCQLLPRCSSSLKYLCSRYAPFFWTATDIRLLEQSIQQLKNLQSLTLCHLDLNQNPTFLQTIGTHCQKITELDLSFGHLPISQCKVIVENFPGLEVLKMRAKSETFRTVTLEEAKRILTRLLKLKILDDDSTAWSCVLPALKKLSTEEYAGPVACVKYLPIYNDDLGVIDTKLVRHVASIKLDGRALKMADGPDVAGWLDRTFLGLESLDMRLENVWFPNLERFLLNQPIGSKVQSIHLSSMPLSYSQFVMIGRYAPNLRKLEVINSSPLDAENGVIQEEATEARFLYSQLEYLSYTGAWDESIASLLLDHAATVKELHLKVYSLPFQFLSRNPLAQLQTLVLDLSYIPFVQELEVNFIRRIIQTAASLREIRLNSRPAKEWEDLRQHLKTENFDLQILRPI